MTLNNKEIKNILSKGGYVSEDDLQKAEKSDQPITDYLLSKGLITKDLLGQAMAEFFNVAYADLNSNQPLKEQVLQIPEAAAKKYLVVLFSKNKSNIVIATDNPKQKNLLEKLKKILKTSKIKLAYALPEDIESVLSYYRKPLEIRFKKIAKSQDQIAPKIIHEVISDAVEQKSSDIHFEPQEKQVIIRFRIDGVLHKAGNLPKEYYESILNKIKVQSNLRIDEHYAAQDGAMRFKLKEKFLDMRVSIAPTVDGEKIVIRLLSEYVRELSLADLGASLKNQKLIKQSAKKPFGMILVAGPTGSGKTTTLYTVLKVLNNSEKNITTIEDPVEYKIIGVNQIQVNSEKNLTFAKGLRSVVRQDPDVILVGEIRDQETAEIAVNAALTGHLLFSTFHANDAATAIPRLLDMGIEPFLLASTLELVIAQRLVRKLCEECRSSYLEKLSNIEKILPNAKKYFSQKNITLYQARGCSACGDVGYKGRSAVFEIIQISPKIQELILKNPSAKQVWELALDQGAGSLFEDGIDKVKQGITTLEELLRVAKPT